MNKKAELVKAVMLLPGTVLLGIPGIILYATRPVFFLRGVPFPWDGIFFFAGLSAILLGLFLMVKTVSLFHRAGDGTPAPWSPPKRFVVIGPYAYVRNPMILAVLLILAGEALFLGSFPLMIWGLIFGAINTVYFIGCEEPGLLLRFGEDYRVYQNNVRRWIPRRVPWKQVAR